MPKKDYVILGNNVYERVNKRPEDIMWPRREENAAPARKDRETITPIDVTHDFIGRIIEGVQSLFWGQSSYTIVFCTLRDVFACTISMRSFEGIVRQQAETRSFDYPCPPNTIASTIHNNGFMRYRTERWEHHRAKPRYLQLVQAVIDCVNNLR